MSRKFHELTNVISVDEDVWRYKIRPEILKSKTYAPTDANEDVNDFVLYSDGRIVLPKYFWHTMYHSLKRKHPDIDQHVMLPSVLPETHIDVKLKDGVEPRPYQKQVIDKVLAMYEQKRHIRAIIRGTTGFGKTFVAIYLIEKTKLKPIIIVHNHTLYKQWQEALLNFLDIEPSQIGTIQGSDIEKIKKELQKDIVIVKIQSLLSQVKRLDLAELHELYKDISLVIMDESHITSAAQKFAKVTSIFQTPNIIGLSATPYRKGIHQLIMDTNIGREIIESDHKNLIPEVNVKVLDCPLDARAVHLLKNITEYVQKLGIYNKAVTESPCYINKIFQDVIELAKEGRHILCIMGNNTQVEKLTNLLNNHGVKATAFIAKNRQIPEDAQVIVSNNQMASTGFSIDSLDTLILANSNIGKVILIQTIGRIVRSHSNKKQPKAFLYFTHDFLKYINSNVEHIVKRNIKAEYGDALKFAIQYEMIKEVE